MGTESRGRLRHRRFKATQSGGQNPRPGCEQGCLSQGHPPGHAAAVSSPWGPLSASPCHPGSGPSLETPFYVDHLSRPGSRHSRALRFWGSSCSRHIGSSSAHDRGDPAAQGGPARPPEGTDAGPPGQGLKAVAQERRGFDNNIEMMAGGFKIAVQPFRLCSLEIFQ